MKGAELYKQICTRGGAVQLSRAKLRLAGGDRVRYLNGQVSNDVRKLTPDASMHACVMTAKGKMSADVFISAGQDDLLVDAELSLRESLAARLERYIISDDVTLEDVTDDFSIIHWFDGSDSGFTGDIPGGAIRKSCRYGRDGWDVFVKPEDFDAAWSVFSSRLPVIDGEMLEMLRIEAGIPRWGFELGEETIPVEAGLDRTAIDYHKGCYIGQEVISRLKSIGHVNRQLRGFISRDGMPLQAGMVLEAPDKSGTVAGRLTSATRSFALEKFIALGYLKRGITTDVLVAMPSGEAGGELVCSVAVNELPFIS